MEREKATHAADLPHEFDGDGATCTVCAGSADDLRHMAWERISAASRETAQVQRAQPIRELGS